MRSFVGFVCLVSITCAGACSSNANPSQERATSAAQADTLYPCPDLEVACTDSTWACGTNGGEASQHCFASQPPQARKCCGTAIDPPPPPPPPACSCANDDTCNDNQKCGVVSVGCTAPIDCGGCGAGYVCSSQHRCVFDSCQPRDCASCAPGTFCSLIQGPDTCVTCGCN